MLLRTKSALTDTPTLLTTIIITINVSEKIHLHLDLSGDLLNTSSLQPILLIGLMRKICTFSSNNGQIKYVICSEEVNVKGIVVSCDYLLLKELQTEYYSVIQSGQLSIYTFE